MSRKNSTVTEPAKENVGRCLKCDSDVEACDAFKCRICSGLYHKKKECCGISAAVQKACCGVDQAVLMCTTCKDIDFTGVFKRLNEMENRLSVLEKDFRQSDGLPAFASQSAPPVTLQADLVAAAETEEVLEFQEIGSKKDYSIIFGFFFSGGLSDDRSGTSESSPVVSSPRRVL